MGNHTLTHIFRRNNKNQQFILFLKKKETMKIFLLFIGLFAMEAFGKEEGPNFQIGVRAPSNYQNCDCQCDSDIWSDGNRVHGNCRSLSKGGALFCYISGRAENSCNDVQKSSFIKDSYGRYKSYSFEACATPPRHKCRNNNNDNYYNPPRPVNPSRPYDPPRPVNPTFTGGSLINILGRNGGDSKSQGSSD